MLEDPVRMAAFRDAIFSVVKKGDIVIDLGSGSGILAIWAAQAGAKKVYAIEETDVADITIEMISANGFDHIIEVLKANSQEVTLPEPADVLIAEIVGHFFFEEGIIEYVADVRDRLLKPNARIIPSCGEIFVAPVELGNNFKEISFWKDWEGLDMTPFAQKAVNTAYIETICESQIIGLPISLFNLNASTWEPGPLQSAGEIAVNRDGMIDAVAGWFTLDLGTGLLLKTGPFDLLTHWKQCIFPLARPYQVQNGDKLNFSVSIEPFEAGSRWNWSLESQGKERFIESHQFTITHGVETLIMNERF